MPEATTQTPIPSPSASPVAGGPPGSQSPAEPSTPVAPVVVTVTDATPVAVKPPALTYAQTAAAAPAHPHAPLAPMNLPHRRPQALPRPRTISGASATSNQSYRSATSRRSARGGGGNVGFAPGTHPRHGHGHGHNGHRHGAACAAEGGDEDGYGSDASTSTMSTLTFELSNTYILPEPFMVLCPFDCTTDVPLSDVHALLDHLLSTHGIKIANVGVVAGVINPYLAAWAQRIHREPEIAEKLASFSAPSSPSASGTATPTEDAAAPCPCPHGDNGAAANGPQHRRVVLTLGEDDDERDHQLRARLTKSKLGEILKVQDKERHTDAGVPRKCLFCKTVAENRAALFRHMFAVHSFNIGLPDNLVYVSHFLDQLSDKLAKLQCLYCERVFKSSAVLRKHMRKKRHFRISPRNHEYDRFYVINYLEPGKNWETLTVKDKYFESDDESVADRRSVYSHAMTGKSVPLTTYTKGTFLTSVVDEEEEASWSDWDDEDADAAYPSGARDQCPCLFCAHVAADADACVAHMAADHAFDLPAVRARLGLSLYQTLVLINYLRKAALVPQCPRAGAGCEADIADLDALAAHVAAADCVSALPAPPAAGQKVAVSVDVAAGAQRAFGDAAALDAVAAELQADGTTAGAAQHVPERLAKVGDTVVVLQNMTPVCADNAADGTTDRAAFWNDPQYLFPALDGDPLLAYCVENDDDDDWDVDPVVA